MPKISGYDMLDILRSTSETKDVKVIMMTALSSEDQRARGEALGANRYLVKSQVGIEDVVRAVHDVLGDSQIGGVPAPSQTSVPVADTTPQPATPEAIPIAEMPTVPVEPTVPQPALAFPTTAPVPQTTQQPTPITAPVQSQPVQPTPAPAGDIIENVVPSQNTAMPQPTAPFSSPAPSSLGQQVVQAAESVSTPQPTPQQLQPTPAPQPVPVPQQPQPIPQPAQPQPAPIPQPIPTPPAQPATIPAPIPVSQSTQPTPQPPQPTPAQPQQPAPQPQSDSPQPAQPRGGTNTIVEPLNDVKPLDLTSEIAAELNNQTPQQ